MNERAIAARVSGVSLLVPGCAGLTYALVVPAFLGREESARAALLQVTLAATAGLALALTVLSFGYLPAIFRAARALRTSGEALDERQHAGVARVDEPVDRDVRTTGPHRRQHRQRVHDVAERAHAHDEHAGVLPEHDAHQPRPSRMARSRSRVE